MPDIEHLQVYTTIDTADAATALARSGVRARLAACGQVVGPIRSTYWWEGEIEAATEWQVQFKTTAGRCAALIEHIRGEHSYQVPEIIAMPIVGGDRAYLDWITEQIRG